MRTFLVGVMTAVALSGCFLSRIKAPGYSPLVSEEVYNYTVKQKTENLRTIAAWYTGNAKNWHRLAEYNGHVRPFGLKPETVVRIPATLVIRYDPIDKSFIEKNKLILQPSKKVRPAPKSRKEKDSPLPSPEEALEPDDVRPEEKAAQESIQDRLIENLLKKNESP